MVKCDLSCGEIAGEQNPSLIRELDPILGFLDLGLCAFCDSLSSRESNFRHGEKSVSLGLGTL
jgi:hypothetical protein